MNYYSHHIGDYRRDTAHLSLLEHGIYRQLLDQYYLDERPICAVDAKLMRSLCARSADEMHAVKSVLADFFILTDAGYVHKRCDIEIEAFHGKSKSASGSAKVRWERVHAEQAAKKAMDDANACERMRLECERIANALPPESEGNANHEPITINQEPKAEPKSKAEATPKAAPATRLPKDWKPDAEQVAFCNAERPDLQAAAVGDRFRDYWIAQPGVKGRKTDWPATWRNWVRNERVQPQARASPASTRIETTRAAARGIGLGGDTHEHETHRIIDINPRSGTGAIAD